MSVLWEQFTEGLRSKGTSTEELLHATEAELEEIFTQHGYRALERAQLRTAWFEKKSKMGVTEIPTVAQTTLVANSSREFGEVKVLLDHYVGPEPSMAVSIVELERITNPVLQKRFERRKSELSGGGGGGAVVRRFHSPVSCSNQKIQDLGFSLPAEGPQMCLRFLTKAPASHPPGAYKLLLCDVAVGKYKAVSGDGASITPEQLVSEAYDSVYLFYSGSRGATDATPDEFILFHPDQVLPRHVVTFLIHPSLASPVHSPSSPHSNTRSNDVSLSHDVKRELSFQHDQRSPPSLYWLREENRLVNGDSLLIGEHRGKRFVSLGEGVERQATEIGLKREVLAKSIDQLRGQLSTLEGAGSKEEEAEAGTIRSIEEQARALHACIEARKDDAVKAVLDASAAVRGRLSEDHSVIADLLGTLEGYASQVASVLDTASTNPEDFVLKSDAFLQEMGAWKPSYSVRATLTIPAPADLIFDIEPARRVVEALSLTEATNVKPRREAIQRDDRHVPLKADTGRGVVIEEGEVSTRRAPSRSAARQHSPDKRSATPQHQQQPPPPPPPSTKGRQAPVPQQQPQQAAPQQRQQPPPQYDHQWEDAGYTAPPAVPALPLPHSAPPSQAPSRVSRSATPNRRPGRAPSRGSKVPTFSIVVVGDPCVGKTRLMEAWLGEEPPHPSELEMYVPSHEPRTYHFSAVTSKGKINFAVSDTPGSQLFPDAMGAADAAVIVFDCTNHTTYDNTSKWYSYLPYHIPVALCGNKSNEAGRVVRAKDITFHKEVNAAIKETLVNYIDISVPTRYNIDKPWQWICRKLMKDSHLVVRELISHPS